MVVDLAIITKEITKGMDKEMVKGMTKEMERDPKGITQQMEKENQELQVQEIVKLNHPKLRGFRRTEDDLILWMFLNMIEKLLNKNQVKIYINL